MSHRRRGGNEDFRCQHCHQPVGGANPDEIGTRNRDHCPACLWSVHVGAESEKDRQSDCRAGMQPAGLTTKGRGELAIVEVCTSCDTVRTNRVAGDDDTFALEKVYEASLAMLPEIRQRVGSAGIKLLDAEDTNTVMAQLFGKGSGHG